MSKKYSDKFAVINHCFSLFSVFFQFSFSCCRGIAVQNRKTQAFIESNVFLLKKRLNKSRGLLEDLKETEAAEIAVLQTQFATGPGNRSA